MPPVSIAVPGAELAFEMRPAIVLHAIVVEQRVVHVEQEYHVVCDRHVDARPKIGLCHLPSAAMSVSASLGPQLPRL